MTVPIGERVAALETSISAFHRKTDVTLGKLAEGQESLAREARAASKDAHLAVTAAEKAADMAGRAHAQDIVVGGHVDEVQATVGKIQEQIKELSINGHGEGFQKLLAGLPILLPWLARQNDLAARSRLRSESWWWKIGRWAVPVTVGAFITAVIWSAVASGIPPH
jgi:hypothetical protein